MLLIEHRAPADTPATERLTLTFELRCKARLRTRLDSGEEVGLFLERGLILRGGDKLLGQDGRVVEIRPALEAVMEGRADDPVLIARAAYHLGNRHVPVQVGVDEHSGFLRFGRDHVLGEMVEGLGLVVTDIEAPFEPESGAYGGHGGHAHPHGHSADGEGRGPRIHDMLLTPRR